MKLVYFVVNKYYPTFSQDEDIIQTGMIGLCNAANTWDEERSTFATYAVKCIHNAILKEFRRRKKHKGVLSLDYEYGDDGDEAVTLGELLVGDEDVPYVDVDDFYERLNPADKQIFDMMQSGLKGVQIAEILGISPQRIHQKVRRIRKVWMKLNGD
jgi:RNA polymerase sporulation-specific sigma factor